MKYLILYYNYIHLELVVLKHAKAIGEWLVDEVIELPHLNPHQRFLLPLLLCCRVLHLLVRRRHMAIEHPEVDAVRLLSQFPRLLHVVQQSDIGAPRYVFDRLPVRRVVHQLVERLLHIVMLELFLLRRVVRDIPRDVRRRVKADCSVDFHQPHSAVQVEAEQLSEHHVVLLREEGADQLSAKWTGCSEVLGAQVVLLHAGDLGLDGHYVRGERIIIVTIVKFRWILQVHLKNETLLFLVCHPMMK